MILKCSRFGSMKKLNLIESFIVSLHKSFQNLYYRHDNFKTTGEKTSSHCPQNFSIHF